MSPADAALTLLAEGSEYALLAARNGAIVLRHKSDHLAAHLQGEEAARLRAHYDAIRSRFPEWEADQTLARLWDQGFYSWLAAQSVS